MLRLVLFGANGQLGTDVRSVFRDSSKFELINITRAQANVELPHTVTDTLKQVGDFDYLINCAAMTNTAECEKLPYRAYQINTRAVSEMAAYCEFYGKTFVHFSTDYIFDGKKKVPYVEEDKPNPLNVYGHTKLLGEIAVVQKTERYFIFRVSSLFGRVGKSGTGINFIETVIAKARLGQELAVVDDQTMSPTHTLDVARTLREFIERGARSYGIYHCTCKGACSWYEFTQEILSQVKIHAEIRPVSAALYPTTLTRPAFSALDTTKIQKIFPPKEWREALAEYLLLKGYTW